VTEIGSSGDKGELDDSVSVVENAPVLAGIHSTVMVNSSSGSS